MSVIKARNFILRSELEDFIKAELEGIAHTIEGTRDELKRLGLSDKRHVFGIRVVCTEAKNTTKVKLEEKLKRIK